MTMRNGAWKKAARICAVLLVPVLLAGCASDDADKSAGAGAPGGGASNAAGKGGSAANAGGHGGSATHMGGRDGSAGSGVPDSSVADALKQFVDAACATARDCCTAAGVAITPLETCEADNTEDFAQTAALAVTVNQPGLTACLAELEQLSQSCTWDGEDPPESCSELFLGTLAEDEPCTESMECSDGLGCLLSNDVGTCRPIVRRAANETCSSSVEHSFYEAAGHDTIEICYREDGVVCLSEDGSIDGTCAAVLPANSPCEHQNCAPGLYCDELATHVCVSTKPVDSPCEHHEECEPLLCDRSTDTCRPQSATTEDNLCRGAFEL